MPKPRVELRTLIDALGARDRPRWKKVLAATPALAREALELGATREEAVANFLVGIGHYVYAGDTALHIAAAAHDEEALAALLALGAPVSARNRRGAEPLHYAADGNPDSEAWDPSAQATVVAALIKAGAKPDSLDASGVAPLHRAVRTRCTGAVKALLKGGADAALRNQSGSTPLELARLTTGRGGSGTEAAKREQREILALLEAMPGLR